MRFFIFFLTVFGIMLLISSCSYKQDQLLFQQKAAISADTTAKSNPESVSNYLIKPQDILQIRNLQNINYIATAPSEAGSTGGGSTGLQTDFQVEQDGTVALPVIGHVTVSGLTRIQAAKRIEGLYRDSLLKDPIIDLKITNLKVTLLGEVKTQGNFPLIKDHTTLVEMIGEAGGLTDRANERDVKIIRGSKDSPKVTEIDLSDINSLNDPRAVLQNGDIIYVAQNKRSVRSDKLATFNTIAQPALLILNTALIIYTLVR